MLSVSSLKVTEQLFSYSNNNQYFAHPCIHLPSIAFQKPLKSSPVPMVAVTTDATTATIATMTTVTTAITMTVTADAIKRKIVLVLWPLEIMNKNILIEFPYIFVSPHIRIAHGIFFKYATMRICFNINRLDCPTNLKKKKNPISSGDLLADLEKGKRTFIRL